MLSPYSVIILGFIDVNLLTFELPSMFGLWWHNGVVSIEKVIHL